MWMESPCNRRVPSRRVPIRWWAVRRVPSRRVSISRELGSYCFRIEEGECVVEVRATGACRFGACRAGACVAGRRPVWRPAWRLANYEAAAS